MIRRLISGVSAAALLAGCSLAPAYHRPVAPIPATWPAGAPYAAPTSPPAAAAAPAAVADWRTLFTDPKLIAVIETALSENRDLRATVANVRAARAQFEAQRSTLFPTLQAGASATYSRTPAPGGGHVETRELAAGLSVPAVPAWELDLFGRQRNLSRAAFEQYLATDEGRQAAQLSLIAETANAYLALAANRSLQKISQATQQSSETTLGLTQSRFDAGVASELDVSQAQTVVQQARADSARFAIAAAQAKNALDLLVGRTLPEAQTPADLAETAPSFRQIPVGVRSDVLLLRPDVLQAEHGLRAANADIGAARAAFFPSISLTGSAGGASSALSGLFRGENSSWSFTPAIVLPIFTGGLNLANLRGAGANRDAAVAQYQGTIQAAFRDVADALAARGGLAEQLSAQTALVGAADNALRLSTVRYQRGVDTYLNTLVAQRTLYVAQQGLVNVQFSDVANLVTLYQALGGRIGG
jgi:multidrug efflux system outer membrane protein